MRYFSTNKMLQERIKDLERLNESLIGQNQILQKELEKSQFNEKYLQNTLFDVVGIHKKEIKITQGQIRQPISIGVTNWGQARQSLEAQAREEYWNKKKQDEEAKEQSKVNNNEVENLEKEVLDAN